MSEIFNLSPKQYSSICHPEERGIWNFENQVANYVANYIATIKLHLRRTLILQEFY
jgi:hypothetical protein